MVDSLHRDVGTRDGGWEIAYEESREQYTAGLEALGKGE